MHAIDETSLVQLGEDALDVAQRHIRQVQHLALNEAGIAFVKVARARGDECDASSWRHEIAHSLTLRRKGRAQQWLWRSDPATRGLDPIPLHFVTLEQLTSDGPYAPIFTNADEPERPQNWLGDKHAGRFGQIRVF